MTFCPSTRLQCRVHCLTCLQWAGGFLVLTGTLGMKVAAPLQCLWTAAWDEAAPSENSISQQSGGSLVVRKSPFQFWVGGVSMSVRYSLLKNCHITTRASVDPAACSQTMYSTEYSFDWSHLFRNFFWFGFWCGWQGQKKKYKCNLHFILVVSEVHLKAFNAYLPTTV